MNIDWKRIKNGYTGFERLAVDYVNDNVQCDGCKWEHTKNTRDSNHDAILVKKKEEIPEISSINTAIFVGYSNNIDIWWMEAKYSSSDDKKILPRYRLDATIVSAILSRNLKKVIFVTNLSISAKTMFDIQKALIVGSSCKEVIFCTKNELEAWLIHKDYSVFQLYFNYSKSEFENLSAQNIISNSGLTFYDIGENLFLEPLNMIYSGFIYEINFDITVFRECRGNLTLLTNLEKKSEDIKLINLKPGTNHFAYKVHVPNKLQYEKITEKDVSGECKTVLPPMLTYEIANYEDNTTEKISIFPNNALEIIDSSFFYINIRSQETLCTELFKDSKRGILDFNRKTTIFYINGKSGVGKSYMLQRYKQLIDNELTNCLCVTYIFTGDQSYDIGVIKRFLFNLFFPYINYMDIDYSYISEFKDKTNRFSEKYWNFILSSTDIDLFMKSCNDKSYIEEILPQNVSINKKIVIFDDLHKLDNKILSFLSNIIKYLAKYNYSIYCILASQKSINNMYFHDMYNATVLSKELKVTKNDISEIICKKFSYLNLNQIDVLFGSVIELVFFLKYLENAMDTIKDYDDFRLAYNIFKSSDILKYELLAKFKDTFRKNADVEALCSCIYYTNNGIDFEIIQKSSELRDTINILLDAELVKKNSNDFYVPWHDYYKGIYVSNLPLKECKNLTIPFKSVYDLKVLLTLEKYSDDVLEKVLEELNILYSKQKFYSIYYILENFFLEKENRIKIKNRISCEQYYSLFAYFCYANTNAGWKYSGYEKFYELYIETQNNKNYLVQSIHYIILWEIINSLYEAGRFTEALEKVKLFHNIPQMVKENWAYIFEWDFKSLNNSVNSVNILIDSEYGHNCINQIATSDKLLLKDVCYTTYRIILCNLVNDFKVAKKILYDYNYIIQNDERFDKKSKYMYDFTVKFFDCIDNVIDISEVIYANEKIKNEFLNDYNRHIYIISLLALIKKDINLCEEYSCEYLKSCRPLKKRQLAFREAYLAVLSFHGGDIEQTIKHLEDELSCLKNYKTYLPVVKHNLDFVKKNKFQLNNITFYYGDELLENKYYIDIRMLY